MLKNKILSLVVFILIFTLINITIFSYLNSVKTNNLNFLNYSIENEAKTLFDNIVATRQWSSNHGGVFVLQKDGIKPNPYLPNNKIETKNGETLIKINPAWMTKQISKINTKYNKHSFRITSLTPINSENKPKHFEIEAINYFLKNTNEKFYSKFSKNLEDYKFMGSLKVNASCLQCHYNQGYSIGDIIGGISIDIPLNKYQDQYKKVEENHHDLSNIIKVVSLIVLIIAISLILNFFNKKEILLKKLKELEELKDENENLAKRYKFALESGQIGIWEWNLLTNEVYFDKNWKKMLGYEEDELPSQLEQWEKRVHPDDKQCAIDDINDNQNKKSEFYINVHRLKHKDGSWVWILDKGKTYFDKNGKATWMIGSHTNITHIKNLEKKLQEKEEMMINQSKNAAMGEMISMIAHQWRQPITSISMAANNILADIDLETLNEEETKKFAQKVATQTQYLSNTIEDFRNFFKQDKELEEVSIETLVNDACSIILASLKNNNIELNLSFDKNITISTYRREFVQVLINLIKNAKEALEENGTIPKVICIKAKESDENIILEIIDNAGGIKNEFLNRIFEAYFTTKEEKNGTGLGLYMSKMIIEKHLNGYIIVENNTGGATFKITLPKNH